MKKHAGHLTTKKIVNLGSFYTPEKFVFMGASWLVDHKLDSSYAIVDSSCGYGAFFNLCSIFPHNRYIGNDIDSVAVNRARENFPFIESSHFNALWQVRREAFGLASEERFCIVGNPPYNDVTSILKNRMKTDRVLIDSDIFTRDLGLSFLNSYAKLQADYALILHPLSYLIKKANFKAAGQFFQHYRILESIVFSSDEFADTSRMTHFPIIMALYQRKPGKGLSYDEIRDFKFQTLEGDSFCLSQWDYLADYLNKYPTSVRFSPEILFYTMRDINALKRSRTFIENRCANAVDIDPQKLPYYCYADLFKRFAEVPYWMGNLDVPFVEKLFDKVKKDIVAVSRYFHPEIFGKVSEPSAVMIANVRSYIENVIRPPQ